MVHYDPSKRPTAKEALDHDWFKGPTASIDQIKENLEEVKTKIEEDNTKNRAKKIKELA